MNKSSKDIENIIDYTDAIRLIKQAILSDERCPTLLKCWTSGEQESKKMMEFDNLQKLNNLILKVC